MIEPNSAEPTDDLFAGYTLGTAFDEMFDRERRPRPHYRTLYHRLRQLGLRIGRIGRIQSEAEHRQRKHPSHDFFPGRGSRDAPKIVEAAVSS